MVSNDNKIFLLEKFGIDCDKYSEERLKDLLNSIIIKVDQKLKELEVINKELKQQIYMLENNIE